MLLVNPRIVKNGEGKCTLGANSPDPANTQKQKHMAEGRDMGRPLVNTALALSYGTEVPRRVVGLPLHVND